MDLGECPKYHDLALKADYEMAAKDKDYYYDIDVSMILVIYGISLKTTSDGFSNYMIYPNMNIWNCRFDCGRKFGEWITKGIEFIVTSALQL